ncbi:MAG: DNA recombination protein RmuC [Rhodobacteraceae bacterium]|nr:DNA recombination protein RmuC [Paracoccaceae bacterium]
MTFDNIDTGLLNLLGLLLVGLVVLILLIRKPNHGDPELKSEIAELRQTVLSKDSELREAWKNADKFEALAGERKEEIERLNGDLSKLRMKLEGEAEEQKNLSSKISRLEAEMKAERNAAGEKIDMLSKLRADMEAKFKELAAEALKLQGEQFSKANIERLQATLTPLKEHVGHFERELKAVHKATLEDRAALKAEINQLSQRSEAISQEAVALTRALRSDQQKQGAWGEMILESILKRSGLREGIEYHTQAHRTGDGGERLRPDVIVNIPGGKTLVVDSKVSLVAYTDAVNAETDEQALSARKRHVASLRGHINGLSAKGYQNAENSTVDYVILFVPIEGALSEALREDGQITEFALDKNVTIATPTTLMMALKTVANVWAVERRNQNAEAIATRAGRLYDKVVGFVDNMENVGKRLDQAQDAYQDAFGQLSRGRGNLLSQVESLKALGAKTSKVLSVDFEDIDGEVAQIEARGENGD